MGNIARQRICHRLLQNFHNTTSSWELKCEGTEPKDKSAEHNF
jgi:hypothetical protein